MKVREIVKNRLHEYFLSQFHLDIDMDTEEDTPFLYYFDSLDLVEIDMDMSKHFNIDLEDVSEMWYFGTIKDIVDSIVTKLKEEGL